MQNVLLTSANFIKSITNISDNVSEKMLLPAIRESQEIGLQEIVGTCLLNKVKSLVEEGLINNEGYEAYKDLLEKAQYFLAYQTVSRLCVILSFKIENAGISRVRDELLDYCEYNDVMQLSDYYNNKADFYKKELQRFLLKNKVQFPELSECDCQAIKANLYSATSSQIFLGGRRGRLLK